MLYIVSTPIGNLEDISFRQAVTLAQSEVILAEDTRSAHLLLSKMNELFGLPQQSNRKIISFYKNNEFEKVPDVLQWLKEGMEISLISEAGTPVISDPGYLLVKHVIKSGLPFTVIPGPSAVTTALIHAGFNPQNFMFIGFLPKRSSEIKKLFTKLQQVKQLMKDTVFVFFESPHRIRETLTLLQEMSPESRLSISREMTKKFEETKRGTAAELLAFEYRGELTVVIE